MNIPRVGLGTFVFAPGPKLLLGRRIYSHCPNTWGIPAGHLEFGETLEEGAIREVKEETGLIIKNPQFVCLTNDFFEPEQKHYVSITMKTYVEEAYPVITQEPDKTVDWTWFNWDNLPQPLFLSLHNVLHGKSYGSLLFP